MSQLASIWFWLAGAGFLAGLTVYNYFYERQKQKDFQIQNLTDSLEHTRTHNQLFVSKNREIIENYLNQSVTIENLKLEVARLKKNFERFENDKMSLNEQQDIEILLD